MRKKQHKGGEINGAVLTRSEKVFGGMFNDDYHEKDKIYIRIKYFVRKEKISYRELALAIGCSSDTVFIYANGKIPEGSMNIGILKRMAQHFGMDEYYFCNGYHVFVDTVDVPEYLKKIREERGMSQKEFAKVIGVSLPSYKKYETGAVRIPEKCYKVIMQMQEDEEAEL